MGAKTWMLVYAESSVRDILVASPMLDRNATQRVAHALFPSERLEPIPDGSLDYTSPPDDEIHIGVFPGVTVVAAKEFGLDHPSELPLPFLAHGGMRTTYLHAMHSVVDWFAFAVWHGGRLARALSVSPDGGTMEDLGARLPFEVPYWLGEFPAVAPEDLGNREAPYPLPFHPLDLGEAALREFFGYQLEGYVDESPVDAHLIPLMCFKRKRSRFKFW